ncbi:MAG: hypothetical protein IPL95_05765 [Saprospiraceae bacterium]|jgi:hypothetical protein|nr:hypothetical protein [Saprospiraceae bacterium]
MIEYKTIFIPIDTPKGSAWTGKIEDVNGDTVSRDIQAAINEKVLEGYKFHCMEAINSTKMFSSMYPTTYTSGFILIFEKQ